MRDYWKMEESLCTSLLLGSHINTRTSWRSKTFLSHVINKHSNLPNRLYNACAHGEIVTPRVWMTKGKKSVSRCTFINPQILVRITSGFRGLTLMSFTVADIIN